MNCQSQMYVTVDLESDTVIQMLPRSCDSDVAITLGCSGNREILTLYVHDPAVLDRLSDLARQAATRAKLATSNTEDAHLLGDAR